MREVFKKLITDFIESSPKSVLSRDYDIPLYFQGIMIYR